MYIFLTSSLMLATGPSDLPWIMMTFLAIFGFAGYSRARYVVWLTVFASIIAGVMYQLVAAIPPASFFTANEAYVTVFYTVPRILIGGWVAVFVGDIANDYVLAKMKIWTSGKYLWSRLIGSTVAGQGVNTILFYLIGLSGIMPADALVAGILMAWLLKSAVEVGRGWALARS